MIYIIVFSISILFLKLAFAIKKNSLLAYKLFIVLSVISPCILASLRDNNVGTDMNVYIVPLFNFAKNSDSFIGYYKMANTSLHVNDILYLSVNYFITRFIDSIEVSLFIQEALVIGPIFMAFFNSFKKNQDIILGALIFYLFLYNASFNMARQSIALAFEILAFSYIEKKGNKYFFIFAFVGTLFHSTAILIVVPYLLYWFYKTKLINKKIKSILILFAILFVTVCVFNINKVVDIITSLNFLTDKRVSSILHFTRNSYDFSWSNTIFYSFIFLLIYFNKRKLYECCNNINFYVMLMFFGVILLQTTIFIKFSERISYYFIYPCIFLVLPNFSINTNNRISSKELLNYLCVLLMFIIYWIYWIVILKYHETIPYVLR